MGRERERKREGEKGGKRQNRLRSWGSAGLRSKARKAPKLRQHIKVIGFGRWTEKKKEKLENWFFFPPPLLRDRSVWKRGWMDLPLSRRFAWAGLVLGAGERERVSLGCIKSGWERRKKEKTNKPKRKSKLDFCSFFPNSV